MQKAEAVRKISTSRDCVRSVLEVAISELLQPPLSEQDNDIETAYTTSSDTLARRLAQHLDDMCMSAIMNDEQMSGEADELGFYAYLTMAAQFVVHSSPSFYTGQHSFTWHDYLETEQIPDYVTNLDVTELFPEIYDNDYLTPQEYEKIVHTREMEAKIAIEAMVNLIDECCGQDRCSINQTMEVIRKRGMFDPESSFSQVRQTMCFGVGNGCMKAWTNKIVIPCGEEDGYCNRISTDDDRSFQRCMTYENFLRVFAADRMQGDVDGEVVGSKSSRVNRNATRQIRHFWRKELKMMRKYLDMQNQD